MGPYSTSMHSQLFIFLFIQQWDAFEWSNALCSISVPYNGKFRPYYLLQIKWKNKTTKKYQWKGLQRWSLNDIQLKCRYMLFKLGIKFIHRVEETKCLAFWGGLIGRLTFSQYRDTCNEFTGTSETLTPRFDLDTTHMDSSIIFNNIFAHSNIFHCQSQCRCKSIAWKTKVRRTPPTSLHSEICHFRLGWRTG